MSKKTIVWLASCVCIFLVLGIALTIYYCGATYPKFDEISKKEFAIPGLDSKFVPQGIDYVESEKKFLVAGYMSDGTSSRVYVVDEKTGLTEKYFTLSYNNVSYIGHAGGITSYENCVWLVGSNKVVRFNLNDALSAENKQVVQIVSEFETGNGCDFVLAHDNTLIVGEFYRKGKYDTPKNHELKVSNGKTNYAMAYVYNIDLTTQNGISDFPIYAISLPNQVQGMTFSKDNNIVLSTSYSIPDSKILIYNNVLLNQPTHIATINNVPTQAFVLDDSNLVSTITAPAMTEEMVTVNERVYVLFESNCAKYRVFNRTRQSHVLSLDI